MSPTVTPSPSTERLRLRLRLQDLAAQVADLSENASAALAHFCEVIIARRERAPFAARAVEALAEAAEQASEETLKEVSGAPSNYAVLSQLLDQPEVLAALRERDPLAPARLRGLRAKERLLAEEGGSLTAAEMASALGLTRQAIDNRRRKGRLIGLDVGRRGYLYPAWQVGPDGVLGGLADVLTIMGAHDPWTHMIFLLSKSYWLDGETPLTVLRCGQVERVVAAARHYGEQGGF